MPEYVYALHDFIPEHDDEIDFKAGDRIEVIEKDDLYGDGWWQGRNLVGKVGLFPQSYTSANETTPMPIPEIRTPTLQPLQEESAEDMAALTPEPNPAPLLADGSPSTQNNGNAVMSATLTDVQRAIEQLAARRDTDDTSRSFSFVSTNHDTESEHEADREDEQHQWHKDARKALAERAQLENARKKEEEEEALRVPPPPALLDIPAIPIAAELSDESDGEDDDNDDNDNDPCHLKQDKAETDTITHTDVTVVPRSLPPLIAPIPELAQSEPTPILTASTTSRSSPIDDTISSTTSISPSASLSVAADIPLPKSPAVSTPTHTRITTPQLVQNLGVQPSYSESHLSPLSTLTPVGTAIPKVLETPISAVTITPDNADLSIHNSKEPSVASSPSMNQTFPSSPSSRQLSIQAENQPSSFSKPVVLPNTIELPRPISPVTQAFRPASPPPPKPTHPSEWTVEQVVDWLKTKGMDEATCSKFIEHEITGDVLLELDTAMLKDEMGIAALGKRMRIQNGIVELKRPISTNISSMPLPIPGSGSPSLVPSTSMNAMATSPISNFPVPAGIQQQQLYNFNGIPVPGGSPGFTNAPFASPALSGSFHSGYGYAPSGGGGSGRTPSIEGPMVMPGNASPYAGSVISEDVGNGGGAKDGGLQPSVNKPRPTHLKFSPSDGALGRASGASELSPTRDNDVVAERDEDKAVQSETDISYPAISSTKRRLFGLSTESGASSGSRKSADSKDKDKASAPTTPRSASIRIGRSNSNVLTAGVAALRSRSPTPVGARRSGESAGQGADDSLVVVSATSSPSLGGKHAKNKKSFDGGLASVFGKDKTAVEGGKEKEKASDRLSFFGSGMSLSKSRKPPPRYSIYEADAVAQIPTTAAERHRSISRFITSSMGLSNSGSVGKKNARPGTAPSGKNVPFGSTELSSPVSPASSASKDDSHIASSPSGTLLRKRHLSTSGPATPPVNLPSQKGVNVNGGAAARTTSNGSGPGKPGKVNFQAGFSVLDQIGQPDYTGWLRKKGDKYNAWKTRYLVLKGPHLYYMKNADKTATKIKGYVKVQGYKIISDETGPCKYGFKIVHETEPPHYFSSDELLTTREWMKALMKATIERDYSKPVISSCNIPTIPLVVAQAMNPAPRPPSPTARDATQRALRRENPNQLSSRDAQVLMGLPSTDTANDRKSNGNGKALVDTFFMETPLTPPPTADAEEEATLVGLASSVASSKTSGNGIGAGAPPKRPSRDARSSSAMSVNPKLAPAYVPNAAPADNSSDADLVDWANSLLPPQYKIRDLSTDLTSGLVFFRLAECIRGRPNETPIPDSLFTGENNLDGMFKLFDLLIDNEIKMGIVSINDIKQGRRDKTIQLLKALRTWGDKRKALARSIGKSSNQAGPWMSMEPGAINW